MLYFPFLTEQSIRIPRTRVREDWRIQPENAGTVLRCAGQCGVVWCGVVWCGVVWCGVWCGVVWCGVVCGVWGGVCCGVWWGAVGGVVGWGGVSNVLKYSEV